MKGQVQNSAEIPENIILLSSPKSQGNMEPKEKVKNIVLFEGGQQFILRISTKEEFNKHPEFQDYLKEVN